GSNKPKSSPLVATGRGRRCSGAALPLRVVPELLRDRVDLHHDSNGRFSRHRRDGLSTPCFAGLKSMSSHATAG
ncbi:MAG TPA: hypothetical protein VK942_05855, partial [Actinomycetes bacterium]|nr:hypothetical protein [Actinomycetes bacterium]